MEVYEIKQNILYNENLKDELIADQRNIEKALEEQEALEKVFNKKIEQVYESVTVKKRRLDLGISTLTDHIILQKYAEGMKELLSGSQFTHTMEGLTEAKRQIRSKMMETIAKLDECEEQINYRSGRITYWKQELRKKQMEELDNE